MAKVLVAGIGNLFLGDDGFGPEVVRQLTATRADRLGTDVRVMDYGIRGMHLAYDLLDGYDALVLVDAVPGNGVPGDISVLEVAVEDLGKGEFDAHAMDPASMLASLDRLGGTLPPTYVLGCQPSQVEERIGLSEPVAAAVPLAIDTLLSLLSDTICATAGVTTRGS